MHNSTCFSTYYPYSTNYGKYIAETGGIFHMKATGIVRRIDDLGRVVVPKEIRRTMRIREGQAMEIYTGREGEIILKKYSPIEELAECAAGFTKSISTVTGCLVCVSDQEQIVAANGPEQKNYLGKSISSRLEEAILNRKTVLARPGEKQAGQNHADLDCDNEIKHNGQHKRSKKNDNITLRSRAHEMHEGSPLAHIVGDKEQNRGNRRHRNHARKRHQHNKNDDERNGMHHTRNRCAYLDLT